MKKIILIQMVLLTSLMAITGSERDTGTSQEQACDAAKKKARMSYQIFQMNSACTCQQTDVNEWSCEVSFSYMRKNR